jgi:mitogen-activated protein kinase organizer 1
LLLTGSMDGSVRTWDLRTRVHTSLSVHAEAKDAVLDVAAAPTFWVSSSTDGSVRLYDLKAGKLRISRLPDAVSGLRLSDNAAALLCGGNDDAVRMLDTSTGNCLNTYRGHTAGGLKQSVAFAGSDSSILATDARGRIYEWDLVSAQVIANRQISPTLAAITDIDISPTNAHMAAITSLDGQIYLEDW